MRLVFNIQNERNLKREKFLDYSVQYIYIYIYEFSFYLSNN